MAADVVISDPVACYPGTHAPLIKVLIPDQHNEVCIKRDLPAMARFTPFLVTQVCLSDALVGASGFVQ